MVGEFVLADWSKAGLNVETAAKRGIYTVDQTLVAQSLGKLSDSDFGEVSDALRRWLGL